MVDDMIHREHVELPMCKRIADIYLPASDMN